MVTIIPLIILFLAALLFVPFARQLVMDKMELANNPIYQKFEIFFIKKTFWCLPFYNSRYYMMNQIIKFMNKMKRKMQRRGFVVIHSLCKSKKQLRCLASSAGASKVTGINSKEENYV